jgi:hypothetical protein
MAFFEVSENFTPVLRDPEIGQFTAISEYVKV